MSAGRDKHFQEFIDALQAAQLAAASRRRKDSSKDMIYAPYKLVPAQPVQTEPHLVGVERRLREYISGAAVSDEVITSIMDALHLFNSDLGDYNAPIGAFVLPGPSGSGKGHLCESVARAIHQVPDRFIRVDCAEYQMGHEIAKLIGAPPGYLGHRETEPVLSAARLGKNTSPDSLVSVIIFDEIEKAHSSLFRILLGVLDKGVLHLGDNTPVKLNNSLIFFTSNLGVSRAAGVGFRPESIAYEAKARKAVVNHFSPEFINRLTGILPFKQITREGAKLILKKFYDEAAYRVASTKMVVFPEPTEAVYAEVLQAGYSEEYGVRELRRAWQRLVILPYVKGLQAPTEGSAIDRAVAKKRRSGLPA